MSGRVTGGASIWITAVDRATKQIDAINKRLYALQRPAIAMSRSLTRFGQLSGLTALANGIRRIESTILSAARAVASFLGTLGVLTGTASMAGLLRLTQGFADFGSQLLFTSRRLGLLPSQLANLQGAAELAGTSAGSATSGFQSLGETIYNAIGGRAPEAVVMANTLGVALRNNLTGAARNTTEVLYDLADKVKALRNPFNQMRVATTFFGGAAADMLPWLRLGRDGMKRYNEVAKQYLDVSDADADRANTLRQSFAELNLSAQGLTVSIGSTLAPVLAPMLENLARLIAQYRQPISTKLAEAVQWLGDAIRNTPWKQKIDEIKATASSINQIAQAIGGWKTVLIGLVAIKLAGWLAPLVALMNPVTLAIAAMTAGVVAAVGTYKLWEIAIGRIADAYDDFIDTRKGRKKAGREEDALQAQFDQLTPAQQAQVNADRVRQGFAPRVPGQSRAQREAADAAHPWAGTMAQSNIEAMIRQQAIARGLDPNVMVALAHAEGGTRKISSAGAIGTMQLEPSTALMYGVNPFDEAQNIEGGLNYFADLLKYFKGNYQAAEAAYNNGPNRESVRKFAETGDIRGLKPETQRYITRIAADAYLQSLQPAATAPSANVAGGTGASPAAQGATTIKGSANLNVNFRNAPPGTTVQTTSEGDVWGRAFLPMMSYGTGPA